MKSEVEFWIDLGPGRAMRVRAVVFEDGLPIPGESEKPRQPNFDETLTLLRQIKLEQIRSSNPL